jgi:23S rRNA pseudouridine2605 synthase
MKKRSDPSSSRKSDGPKSYKKDASRKYGSEPTKSSGKPSGTYKKKSAGDGDKADRPFRGDREEGSGERRNKKFSDAPRKSSEGFGKKRDFDKPAGPGRGTSDRKPGRPYSGRTPDDAGGERPKRSFGERPGASTGGERGKAPYNKDKKPFSERSKPSLGADRPRTPYDKDKKPYAARPKSTEGEDRPKRPYSKEKTDRPFDKERPKRSGEDRPAREREDKPFTKDKKPFSPRPRPAGADDKPKKPYSKEKADRPYDKDRPKRTASERPTREGREDRPARKPKEEKPIEAPMTLNKYIAHSGECSRRDAAELVKQGKVRVNGELVLEPGYRVSPGDDISMGGKKLTPQKNLVYILLNKPKDFITTTDDPEGRKTVMDLVESAEVGRVYPIGRLDRNTTGLLLLTNDGTLAQKLSHPSHNVRKVYQVTLDKNLTRADYDKIVKGLELEDGIVNVDALAYLESRDELGIEIHSGKNRIVRRIFESLGYVVEKLDRVSYAGLTKKNLPRGKWRFLDEKETILLKHFKN